MAEETNRRPSYDARGNVRAMRSQRGAPQADTTQNIGSIDVGRSSLAGTSQGVWDQKFRNRVTGETPSSLAAQRNGTAPQVGNVGKALDEISRSQFGFDQQPFKMTLGGDAPTLAAPSMGALPSLGTPSMPTSFSSARPLAPLGQQPFAMNIQSWKTDAGKPNQASWSEARTPGRVGRGVASKYGWGTSYRTA